MTNGVILFGYCVLNQIFKFYAFKKWNLCIEDEDEIWFWYMHSCDICYVIPLVARNSTMCIGLGSTKISDSIRSLRKSRIVPLRSVRVLGRCGLNL